MVLTVPTLPAGVKIIGQPPVAWTKEGYNYVFMKNYDQLDTAIPRPAGADHKNDQNKWVDAWGNELNSSLFVNPDDLTQSKWVNQDEVPPAADHKNDQNKWVDAWGNELNSSLFVNPDDLTQSKWVNQDEVPPAGWKIAMSWRDGVEPGAIDGALK